METTETVSLAAYAHPIFIGLAFLMALVVFNQGLRQRDQRVRRTPPPSGNLKKHVRIGPWLVGALVFGAVLGVLSSVFVRGWRPLATVHGWLGLVAVALFVFVWVLGRRLLEGEKLLAERHGLVGLAAIGVGALASVTGIALLP